MVVVCKHWNPTQHLPPAGSLAGAGGSRAHAEVSACTSLAALPEQASCNNPASSANTEAAAADTPTQGPLSSADFVLTAPDTQGNQQVLERIHLTSPTKMLAADTITQPPASGSPAAGLHVPGQVSISSVRTSMADASQLTPAPAVHGSPDALHDSCTSADTSKSAPTSGLLGVKYADAHTGFAGWPGEQTLAGNPVSPGHQRQQDSMSNAGTTLQTSVRCLWGKRPGLCQFPLQACFNMVKPLSFKQHVLLFRVSPCPTAWLLVVVAAVDICIGHQRWKLMYAICAAVKG